ncbi:hypothetical protein AB0N61_12160 [Microbacterium sp. NPDC089320]|uniref:hypothetical protein n=1 Tax=Microbacterium sp. NPDC089320 TaxID=3155182 RepID=UPI003442D88A
MNRSPVRHLMSGALVVGAVSLLTGCVNAPTVDVLDSGEPARLPASVTSDQLETVVPDTARLIGEDSDGHTFYAVEASGEAGPGRVCLVIDGVEHGPVMACGAMPIEVESDGVRARLSVEVVPEDSGEKIGEYLRVFL